MSSLPPPHFAKNLDREWFADPFDPRLRSQEGNRLSVLGVVAESYAWLRRKPTPDPVPLVNSFRAVLRRECPDVLADIDRTIEEQKHEPSAPQT